MTTTHKAGATVYTEDGRRAQYVSTIGRQHAIQYARAFRGHEDDEYEEYYGPRIETVDRVFQSPPVDIIDAEITSRQAKLDELTQRALEKSQELAALDKEHRDRMAFLQQHEELKGLEDWLTGKITHFVTAGGYYPDIGVVDMDAALAIKSDYGNHRTGTDTLTLKVGWDKKLTWRRTEKPQYEHMRPHTSLEAAQADAVALIENGFAAWALSKDKSEPSARSLIRSAKALGIPVPREMVDFLSQRDIAIRKREVEEKRAALDVALAKLSAVGGTA